MKAALSLFIRRHYGFLLIVVGVIAYVSVSGMFGACPMCRAVTKSVGLPSLTK
ncbi:hypothetical protein [Prosthecobacter sp.]|jgi:hypothetical protein|uniref:hypothetical protein n=1 Tax=Prosthecobacter sp. TaxID=1965333 RepID=UPI003784C08A